MCTSLQSIVSADSRYEVEQFFQYKHYPCFQLQQFYTHLLFQQNDHFHFFIDILQEWNRKQHAQQLPNSSYTLYYKNVYIYNNLRTALLHHPPHAALLLQRLYDWHNSTRNSKIRVIEKKQQEQHVDQTWEIRNTFKSNLPAEIDFYRRRLICDFSNKDNIALRNSSLNDNIKNRKIKTQSEKQATRRELELKRVIKIQNEVVRTQRERNELMEVEARWKAKKAHQEEFMLKKYYNAGFSTSKTFFPTKRNSNLKRSQTSSGIRNSTAMSAPWQANLTSKFRKSQDKTDKFQEFESSQVRLSDITGLNLLVNPSEKKLKKRKNRR